MQSLLFFIISLNTKHLLPSNLLSSIMHIIISWSNQANWQAFMHILIASRANEATKIRLIYIQSRRSCLPAMSVFMSSCCFFFYSLFIVNNWKGQLKSKNCCSRLGGGYQWCCCCCWQWWWRWWWPRPIIKYQHSICLFAWINMHSNRIIAHSVFLCVF